MFKNQVEMKEQRQTAGETAIQVFTFNPSNKPIRVEMVDEEPWFVAKDLCDILELNDVRRAVEPLDDDEKQSGEILQSGQRRSMWLVSESGMYALVIRSNKPEAKALRKWVTSEVLPSIRKTGRYEMARPMHGKRTFDNGVLDLRCEPYVTKWLGTTTVRMVEYEDVEWYSMADILRAMQVSTSAQQNAQMLRDANPKLVRKIYIFGNTHPAWFTTITGLRLLVSGSRKLKTRSQMLQLEEGGAR